MDFIFLICIFYIFYVYIGYPFFIYILIKIFNKDIKFKKNSKYSKDITLIIAAYNEQKTIACKIENTINLKYLDGKIQIIVVADGSDDDTSTIADNYKMQGVEVLYQPLRQGKSAALNRAVSHARHEIIVFSDANNMYAQDALSHLLAPFSDKRVGLVCGAKIIIEEGDDLSSGEGLYWKYESFIKKCESIFSSCTGVNGEIMAIRQELYTPIPEYIINDDFYLALQVLAQNKKVIYAPSAISLERASMSWQEENTRRSRIIAGRMQAIKLAWQLKNRLSVSNIWQLVSHKFMRPFVPFFMLGAFFSNLLVLYYSGPLLGFKLALSLFFGQIAIYLTAFWPHAWKLPAVPGLSKLNKFISICRVLVKGNLASLQGIWSYYTGQSSSLWQRVSRRD